VQRSHRRHSQTQVSEMSLTTALQSTKNTNRTSWESPRTRTCCISISGLTPFFAVHGAPFCHLYPHYVTPPPPPHTHTPSHLFSLFSASLSHTHTLAHPPTLIHLPCLPTHTSRCRTQVHIQPPTRIDGRGSAQWPRRRAGHPQTVEEQPRRVGRGAKIILLPARIHLDRVADAHTRVQA
jgi:hypothetical protein